MCLYMNAYAHTGRASASSFTAYIRHFNVICDGALLLVDDANKIRRFIQNEITETTCNRTHKRTNVTRITHVQGIRYERLDGTMQRQQRVTAIERFHSDIETRVFLISLKSGGMGLNLVAANHVLLTDLWWNAAAEDQASLVAHVTLRIPACMDEYMLLGRKCFSTYAYVGTPLNKFYVLRIHIGP